MDGKTLKYHLRNCLNEDSSSSFMDDYTSYYYLYEAAVQTVQKTKCLHTAQSITTVADQSGYTLNADYMGLYLQNEGKYYIKYTDSSSNDDFLYFTPYERVIYDNQTTSVTVPGNFSLVDDNTLDSQVTGTATSTAAASGGVAVLTDTAGDFSDVSVGDIVHNTTDGSDGVVVTKTSSTVLSCALFNGTANDWTSGDAYVIQPQGRMQLVLDPPPSTSGDTVTIYYVQRPVPVFSDYGVYRFPPQYTNAMIKYAAWLYKYKDREPDTGDAFYQYWLNHTGVSSNQINHAFNRRGFGVNLKARRGR